METENDSSPKLKFKPIHQGLGFHPFSDGLPYAPVVKKPQRPTGSGAVAAGAPKFISPKTISPALEHSLPLEKPLIHVRGVQTQTLLKPHKLEINPGFDFVIKRFFAGIIDLIFNVSICLIALSIAALQLKLDPRIFRDLGNLAWVGGFLLFFHWALLVSQEVAVGTTLGKRMFGLVLKGGPFQKLWRALLFPLSILTLGLGLLISLFDSKKRCLHDLLSGLNPQTLNP